MILLFPNTNSEDCVINFFTEIVVVESSGNRGRRGSFVIEDNHFAKKVRKSFWRFWRNEFDYEYSALLRNIL
jgi:hypothetical protein